ncbi:MAG: hypothetical protein HYZ73_03295 [Elusimicrobia bacterium]|nr:hypothetical protein [Elusimicrobiota bacterium]
MAIGSWCAPGYAREERSAPIFWIAFNPYGPYQLDGQTRYRGLRDWGDMLRSTTRWPAAYRLTDAFDVDLDDLSAYFDGPDDLIRDGFARFLTRGYLELSPYFVARRDTPGQWLFDPSADAWKEPFRELKRFITNRRINDPKIVVFIDTYDVADGLGLDAETIPADHYVQEVLKNVQAIRDLFRQLSLPDPLITLHELLPRRNPSSVYSMVLAHLPQFEEKQRTMGIQLDGLVFDAFEEDPRSVSDSCRDSSIPLDVAEEIFQKTRDIKLKVGLFIVPHTARANPPCPEFGISDQQVFESYVASARQLTSLRVRPDFYFLASWMDYPRTGLPETGANTVTRAILEVNRALCKRGDANCDGVLDARDVQICVNFIRDGHPLSLQERCDLNRDGQVTQADIHALTRQIIQ